MQNDNYTVRNIYTLSLMFITTFTVKREGESDIIMKISVNRKGKGNAM